MTGTPTPPDIEQAGQPGRQGMTRGTMRTGGDVNRNLLSVAEASRVLGVSQMTVRRLLDNREIEYLRISKTIRIPEDALASYMNFATVKPLR